MIFTSKDIEVDGQIFRVSFKNLFNSTISIYVNEEDCSYTVNVNSFNIEALKQHTMDAIAQYRKAKLIMKSFSDWKP